MSLQGQLRGRSPVEPALLSDGANPDRWIESRRGRTLALVLLLALATGLPLGLSIATGSISIPHNDAWSHAKIAQEFGRTGAFQLVGWNRTALVGQVVPLGPLATSIVAQQLFVAALSLVALLATYAYLRSRVAVSAALLGTVVVGAVPEFGLLSTSFMSDVPAFAALMVCLVLTDRALRTQKPRYLALALLVGVWGVTIREQDIVGPVVAAAVTSLAWRGRKRAAALVLASVAAVAVIAFELWRRSLPYADSPTFDPEIREVPRVVILGAFSIALFVAPVVFSVARPARWRPRTRWLSAVSLLPVLAVVVTIYPDVFLPNYLDPSGAYSKVSVGLRQEVIPPWAWICLIAIACVSVALLVGLLLEKQVGVDRVSGLVGALLIAGTVAQAAAGQFVFSRYLLPLVPLVCAALLRGRVPRRPVLVISTLAVLAFASICTTADALSFDAARWQAASMLERQGVPATDIDAGLEWVGYHATQPADQHGPARPEAFGSYMRMFGASRECSLVSASELSGPRLTGTYGYSTYGVVGTSQLWIYRTSDCPSR